MDEETKTLLTQAVNEIRGLRRQNEIYGAQLEVVEVFRAALLGPRPPQSSQSYGVDITHLIEIKLDVYRK